ncbi:DUF3854 domain-containing protein [Leptolyngbya sp. PCC 6406]|uniref:DUF3854 domain-containing protein n=1 Tax=Leptolyngbya sp. PCC 6406 TaxID=1173264 RepID=UPI0002ABDB91|nr:DUF3854 domain-containing protein [Leptolyngbya sp. PCC 6406]
MESTLTPRDTGDRGGYGAWQSLEEWMLADFRRSAIPDRLTTTNVQVLSGDAAIQEILEDKIAQSQKVTSYITVGVQRLLTVYEPLRDGIWCTLAGVPYAKAINPRPDPHKLGKHIKYETPPGAIAEPILPLVDDETAAVVYGRYGIEPLPGQSFWEVVALYNLPVAITEGLKKALSLIAHGLPAIAVRGITQWHVKGSLELHTVIERFATKGRQIFIVFDQDSKPKTIANVHRQVKQLGTILAEKGCEVRCPIWHPQEGKGIDDVLYRYTDAAKAAGICQTFEANPPEPPAEASRGFSAAPRWSPTGLCPSRQRRGTQNDSLLPDNPLHLTGTERLEEILNTALTLKQYKRDGRIAAALNAIHRHNALTFPIERTTEGNYLPPLPKLTPSVIHVVDATMNTGKTYRIGRDWVQTALQEDKHVLVLSPLNSLGQQTAKDWDILHIHDQGATGQNQREFWEAARQRPGIVLCPDSIGKLPEWFWTKPVVLIVDEGNQVTEHICQGDTLKSRYGTILERIASAAKHAIASGGAIVLSEDGIPDRAVRYWQTLSGTLAVRCFRHRKQGLPWDCQVFSGKASGFRQRLLHHLEQGKRLLFVTSSQREAKRLDRILQSRGLSSTRIDSETNEGGAFNLFFKDPDHWLQVHRPDVLILSPSAKSGISIEGGMAVEDAYFDEVWAYFPALSTDTHLQMLGRYRPTVPRRIFIPPFITGTADEALGNPRAIKQRLTQNLTTLARLFDLGTGDHDLMGVESAIVDYLTTARTVSGSQKAIAQEALIDRLEGAGHTVTTDTLQADKATAELWQLTQEQIWLEEAVEIAAAEPEAAHTLDWAHRTLDSLESSREARLIAYKVLCRDEFPGIDFDDAEDCYEVLCKDYGSLRRGVLLQGRAENLEAIKACDRDVVESILASSIRAPHRLPRNYVKAAMMAKLGVLNLLDGKPWTNTDNRAIAIKQTALRFMDEVRYWLNLNINPDQTPCEIANKLVKRLGLNVAAIGRPGRRAQTRARLYAATDLDNPIRLKLLQAIRQKLSDSVSTISNQDQVLNQEIVDTGASNPPDQGATQQEHGWQIGDWVQIEQTIGAWVIDAIEGAVAQLSRAGTPGNSSIFQPLAVLRRACG